MIKNAALVRNKINTPLKNPVQNWYTAELINLKRIELRSDINNLNAWCSTLIKRFKNFSGVVLTKLTAEKYTVKNVKNRREISAYVQIIIRHARAANIKRMLNQFIFAHEGIAAEFRVFVDSSNEIISVSQFIKTLDFKKQHDTSCILKFKKIIQSKLIILNNVIGFSNNLMDTDFIISVLIKLDFHKISNNFGFSKKKLISAISIFKFLC